MTPQRTPQNYTLTFVQKNKTTHYTVQLNLELEHIYSPLLVRILILDLSSRECSRFDSLMLHLRCSCRLMHLLVLDDFTWSSCWSSSDSKIKFSSLVSQGIFLYFNEPSEFYHLHRVTRCCINEIHLKLICLSVPNVI